MQYYLCNCVKISRGKECVPRATNLIFFFFYQFIKAFKLTKLMGTKQRTKIAHTFIDTVVH